MYMSSKVNTKSNKESNLNSFLQILNLIVEYPKGNAVYTEGVTPSTPQTFSQSLGDTSTLVFIITQPKKI